MIEGCAIPTVAWAIPWLLAVLVGCRHREPGRDRRPGGGVDDRLADLERAVAAAEAATRAKSAYVATVSHEIRTPLGAILGMTELAQETADPQQVREFLAVIRRAGQNLLGVLDDVLDLAKIEAGKLELEPRPTDLEGLLADTLKPLAGRLASPAVTLVLDVAPELASHYVVDAVRLRQIVTNLVGNAAKFTSRGHILVQVRKATDFGAVHELELVVADTGIGIPADRLGAVFAPFTQADASVQRRFAGTGLGLSITDHLLRAMGGRIVVESELQRGTRFRALLPLEVAAAAAPAHPTPSGVRVLWLGEDPHRRSALANAAAALGVPFVAAADGLPTTAPPRSGDVVLLEPGSEARTEAAVAWSRHDRGGMVFLTTHLHDLAIAGELVRRHGFAGHLVEPIARADLLATLHRAAAADAVAAAGVPAAQPAAADRTLRILVAEDDPLNQHLLARVLGKDGHQVHVVGDGEQACATALQAPFDLILLDMEMPVLGGVAAARRLRAAAGTARTPIVALTANATAEDRARCLAAGMDEVLHKPLSLARLRATLQRFGSTRR